MSRASSQIGRRIPRREDERLLRGCGRYVDDIALPGLLQLAILRSPIGHARIERIETRAAAAAPGVAAVLTGESLGAVAGALPSVTGMPMVRCPEHHPLAIGTARFEGEGVAAVLATDRATAEDALEKIEVEYRALPAVTDPLRALEPDAPVLHEHFGTNLSFRVVLGGDRSQALRDAHVVVTQRMQSQRIVPSPMETRGIVAHRDPRDGRLVVQLSTQAPHLMRSQIAGYLGLSEHRVRVVAPDVGGAFGAKNNPYAEEMLAAALALRLGRPVKWIEDRVESMVATSHGRGQVADVEVAATRDGRITSLHLRLVLDIGAYHHVLTPMGPFQTAMLMTGCYRIPCAGVEILGAFTNKTPVDPYRGFGRSEAAYYLERAIDLVARRLELDPVEIRRRNFVPPDAFPYTTPLGHVHEAGDYGACLDRALAAADYAGLREWQERLRRQGRHPGIGISTHTWRGGFPSSAMAPGMDYIKGGWERATVRVEPDGDVTLATGVSPQGQGIATCFAQIAAETLGLPPEAIRVVHGDTDTAPYGNGTMGSRSIPVGGSAVLRACQALLATASRAAAHALEVGETGVRFEGGRFVAPGEPERALTLAEVARRVYSGVGLPPGLEPCLESTRVFDGANFTSPFGAHLCAVEVDVETGAVKILRYLAVENCGRAIHPGLVEGQIRGGIAQGIGQALLEAAVYDPEGRLLTHTLLDYLLPRCTDLPEIEVLLEETPTDVNPLGARSVGEAGTVGAPPAVANAVLDALAPLGIRHLDTPLEPERIWRALTGGTAAHRISPP